eukprot:TRINITY_DN234_c0_g2_i2.p3 TRINITY_DN234_c0_g2~~TRINITY_DN234_c0_g2_i2.p3  ORF type:complete len:216 (+),score=-18.39 TRINITY_DN234_c0_g2_i2:747-1394(+)
MKYQCSYCTVCINCKHYFQHVKSIKLDFFFYVQNSFHQYFNLYDLFLNLSSAQQQFCLDARRNVINKQKIIQKYNVLNFVAIFYIYSYFSQVLLEVVEEEKLFLKSMLNGYFCIIYICSICWGDEFLLHFQQHSQIKFNKLKNKIQLSISLMVRFFFSCINKKYIFCCDCKIWISIAQFYCKKFIIWFLYMIYLLVFVLILTPVVVIVFIMEASF